MKLTEQSEMKMETGCRPASRRYRRISQASWWFGQMHRAVEKACPSETAPARRVEQRVLPLANREYRREPEAEVMTTAKKED